MTSRDASHYRTTCVCVHLSYDCANGKLGNRPDGFKRRILLVFTVKLGRLPETKISQLGNRTDADTYNEENRYLDDVHCSLLNHSCDPVADTVLLNYRTIVLRSKISIPDGHEVTISYTGHYSREDRDTRQGALQQGWGFMCG